VSVLNLEAEDGAVLAGSGREVGQRCLNKKEAWGKNKKIGSLSLSWQLNGVNLFHCNYCEFGFQEGSVPQQSPRVESF